MLCLQSVPLSGTASILLVNRHENASECTLLQQDTFTFPMICTTWCLLQQTCYLRPCNAILPKGLIGHLPKLGNGAVHQTTNHNGNDRWRQSNMTKSSNLSYLSHVAWTIAVHAALNSSKKAVSGSRCDKSSNLASLVRSKLTPLGSASANAPRRLWDGAPRIVTRSPTCQCPP